MPLLLNEAVPGVLPTLSALPVPTSIDSVCPAATVSDPPTQSEMQQVVDKMNELINALRR